MEKVLEATETMIGYREGNSMPKAWNKPVKRIMIGIPMTGLLRSEWVMARYSQVIPCNWSQVEAIQWLDQYSPLDFSVADARNFIATAAVDQGFEWLFFLDHDTVLPPASFLKLNELMIKKEYPVWSGLYFTRSVPAEPLVYRGRGNGYFADWEMGDLVEVDGLPMGCTLISVKLLKVLYDESVEYMAGPYKVRQIFLTPSRVWFEPDARSWFTSTGTEDLEWCTRVMRTGALKKAGWDEFADKEFPFVVDTSIFCRHIDMSGVQYPTRGEEQQFKKEVKK
jgi:hypothetical protein